MPKLSGNKGKLPSYSKLIKKIDIEKEVTSRLEGEEKGDNWLCFCPFHANVNTPALGVNLKTGIFGCFSCGARGNFFDLIVETDGVSVEEAIALFHDNELVEKTVPVNSKNLVRDSLLKRKQMRMKTRRVLSGDYLKKFKTNNRAYLYLQRRSISIETSRVFNIRWGGGEGYWQDRVIFPLFNKDGRLISLSGRHINKNAGTEKMRHLYRSDQKRGLYGYKQAAKLLSKASLKYVVLVEGQIDVMSLYEVGIPAISSNKMLISSEQATLIALLSDSVYIGVDNDVDEKGGGKAIQRIVAHISEYARCKRLRPILKDWNDDLVKYGKEAVYKHVMSCIR